MEFILILFGLAFVATFVVLVRNAGNGSNFSAPPTPEDSNTMMRQHQSLHSQHQQIHQAMHQQHMHDHHQAQQAAIDATAHNASGCCDVGGHHHHH